MIFQWHFICFRKWTLHVWTLTNMKHKRKGAQLRIKHDMGPLHFLCSFLLKPKALYWMSIETFQMYFQTMPTVPAWATLLQINHRAENQIRWRLCSALSHAIPILGINCPLPADWEPSHCWWKIQLITTEFILVTAGAQCDVWRGTALLQKSIIPPSHTSEPYLAPILQSRLYGHRIGTNAAETCSSSPYTCLCQINLVQTSAEWESVQ